LPATPPPSTSSRDDTIITAAFMTELDNDLKFMGKYTGDAAGAAIDSKLKTQAEDNSKTALLEQVPYIQSKAKLKYSNGNRSVLAEYGIGTNIDISRPALETAAANILNKLKTDTLPKITVAHGTALQHAADGEFPYTDPANAGMRKKFDLPSDRPMNP
jgi:hypothetical protein